MTNGAKFAQEARTSVKVCSISWENVPLFAVAPMMAVGLIFLIAATTSVPARSEPCFADLANSAFSSVTLLRPAYTRPCVRHSQKPNEIASKYCK